MLHAIFRHPRLFSILAIAPIILAAQDTTTLAEGEGLKITTHDVSETIAGLGDQAAIIANNPDLRFKLIDNIVSRNLLEKAAKSAGIENDPVIKKRLDFVKTDLIIQLFIEREATARLDEKGLRAYFEENRDRFSHKEVRVARLLSKDREKATRWQQTILRAPEKLGDLAARESEDKNSAKTKGDLGFSRKGALDEPLDTFAFNGKRGDVSSVLHLKDGFAIAVILDIKPGKPISFDEARSDIERLARANVERQLIAELRAKANVKMNDSNIKGMVIDAPPR